jgi:diacylglycerol kinase (ATP)
MKPALRAGGGAVAKRGDRLAGKSVLREERDSFGHAFRGLLFTWETQRHLRVHLALATLAVLLGLILRIGATEWALLALTIALVLSLELLNTVVEAVVDLVTPDYHPLARVAKDVAAGAVLVSAIGGLAVGAFLFLPRLWALALSLLSR